MRIDCKIEKATNKPLLVLHGTSAKPGFLTVFDGQHNSEAQGAYIKCQTRNPKSTQEHTAALALLASWLNMGV